MHIETETPLFLETAIMEPAATKASERGSTVATVQFWSCAIMSCALLFAGAWLLYAGSGPESLASSVFGNAAVTIWLCVPTCICFAWQGYRKMRAADRN
jgi:hypothetical protein